MIRCTSKKESFRNLTVNKEYEATEDGDRYIITNDAGLETKYAKKYFTTVVVAPRPVSIIDALNVVVSYANDNIDVSMTIANHRVVRTNLNLFQTTNSCGIKELQGISPLKNACRELFHRINHDLYPGTLIDMWRKVYQELMVEALSNCGACVMLTDAIWEHDAAMNDVISDNADAEWTGPNDNSGNTIIVWIVGKNALG